jgi:PAS domain S-box-containing protein
MSILEIVPPERKAALTQLYQEVFKGNPKTSVVQIPNKGKLFYYKNEFNPAFDDEGNIIGALVTVKDITTETEAEKNLKEVEERWRFALEGAQQGVWDWNMLTGEVYYSDSYKKLYGYDDTDLKGRIEEWASKIHPDDKKVMNGAIEKHATSSNPYYESTYRIRAKNGEYRWILARGMITERNAAGKAIRMLGTHTDITDQVKKDERYKLLFYNNPLPMWIYDLNSFRFIAVNNAAISHYGYTQEEFLSMTIFDIRPESEIERLKIDVQLRNQQGARNNIWKHRKKNGSLIDVEVSTQPLDETRSSILVLANDITEKIKVEEELRKSNERFSYAAKAASEALWEWDIPSGEVYMSHTYTEILGWAPDHQSRFEKWHELIHPDDREATTAGYYKALANPEIEHWEKEYRFLKADGSYCFVFDKAVILRQAEGKAYKVIGAIQDITDKKMAEEELIRSNERFLLASRAASDAIYDWDIKANAVEWGEGLQTFFGLYPSDVTISVWESLIHPDDRKRISDSINKALKNDRVNSWRGEYRFARADGSYSYVLDRGYISRDKNGDALRMIGSMHDITQRKYNEHLLNLERTIFELSSDPSIDFKYIVNKLLAGIEEIHTDTITSVLLLKENGTVEHLAAPSLPIAFTNGINGAAIGPEEGSCGAAMYFKKTVIVSDIENDPLWATYKDFAAQFGLRASWSLPIIHSSGKVMGSFAVYHKKIKEPTGSELDTVERIRNILRVIMENRRSLQEIKIANERFDIMMKATHDLIWDWGLESGIIYRDPLGLKKVYGTADNQPIENINQWMARIHKEDHEHVQTVISNILQAKEENTFDVEYRFLRDDGTYSHVYDRGVIIRDDKGKPVRMIGAAQDISERKRLERELIQNELERQKAINQATIDTQEQERGEIGKELHDNVNQVLTTTKLYLDLALSNPELKDELILKSNKNIITVINEIRQLSRSLMDPSIGDLGLIDSIHDLIENINLTRKLHVSLAADKKVEQLLDKNQKLTVFRIIQETLNNAIKHAKATSVSIHFHSRSDTAELMIQDDGIGFDPKSVKKGAGLKNIQNRVYLINGNHSIQSKPGKGCKILIDFPFTKLNKDRPD